MDGGWLAVGLTKLFRKRVPKEQDVSPTMTSWNAGSFCYTTFLIILNIIVDLHPVYKTSGAVKFQ